MRRDRRSGHPTQGLIGQKGRGNQNAIGKIMDRVANQDQRSTGSCGFTVMAPVVLMPIALVVMTVAQYRQFFETEESKQPKQQPGADLVNAATSLNRLRQQVQSAGRQQ